MAKDETAIKPTRAEDFPEWYQQVVRGADMAENSEVRGCMVIKPWGYGLWEQIQSQLDALFKKTGHKNAYFPLLIPLSYLEKEAAHVEGFAKECAVVTHHRLEQDEDGKLVPTGELTEPFVIRPTSETIIGAAFARWIESWRDLPLLLNQWANVMRWEMRPRLFLRTAEFLWQEGHTAHESAEQALEEAHLIRGIYEEFLRDFLAIPVIPGEKTERERFPGAVNTWTVEAMVQDKKAIQAGTSHFLGQNFAKAQDITFTGRDEKKEHAWTTSWGVSTRLIGTLLMAHGDDDGAIIPPRVAPTQIVILPVVPKEEYRDVVFDACDALAKSLHDHHEYYGAPIRVEVDKRDIPGGARNWEWIKKGVPLRVELGPRDLAKRTVAVSRRDTDPRAKDFLPKDDFIRNVTFFLQDIQDNLVNRATRFRDENIVPVDTLDAFETMFAGDADGGFALAHWAGTSEDEEKLSADLKVTIRCIPSADTVGSFPVAEEGTCFLTGKPSSRRVIFAKAY